MMATNDTRVHNGAANTDSNVANPPAGTRREKLSAIRGTITTTKKEAPSKRASRLEHA